MLLIDKQYSCGFMHVVVWELYVLLIHKLYPKLHLILVSFFGLPDMSNINIGQQFIVDHILPY